MAPFRDQLTEVRREAAQARERLEAQARQARQEAEERARQAEQDLRTQAVAVQASIRKAQSEAERVAEARKAEARKAETIERRKVDLPGIRPRDLGTAEFISTVDAERKRAHTEGRSARAEVDKEREKLGGQIEEAREAAFADIDKQKGVIDVDLAKAVAGAMFDIEEQHALLLTGVKEWEEDSTAAVKKAEAEYNKAVTEFEAAHIELDTGEVVSKAEWDKLDKAEQDRIKEVGWDAYVTQREDVMKDMMSNQWATLDGKADTAIRGRQDAGVAIRGRDADIQPVMYRLSYDIVGALQGGYDRSKLEMAFGKEAVERAQHAIDTVGKIEKEGKGSPTWALYWGHITVDDLREVYGDEAADLIGNQERFEEAKTTLRELNIRDPDNSLAAQLRDAAAATQFGLWYGMSTWVERGAVEVGKLQTKAQSLVSAVPSGTTWQRMQHEAWKVPLGIGTGAIMSVVGTAHMIQFAFGIPAHLTDKQYYASFGEGMKNSILGIPAMVAADPVWGTSTLVGFILGPLGVKKLAQGIATKASPWYVPNTGMRFSFTTGKVPTRAGDIGTAIKAGKLTEVQVANAITRATSRAMQNPAATATARLGRTNIRIHIEPTPTSKYMGGALWRAVPIKDAYRNLAHVVDVKGKEPASFYSLHAAPRFAMTSAHGVKASSPALIMVYTKAGKLTPYPTTVQYASNLATMAKRGFDYLGSGRAKPGAYGPIKTYAARFELEAMLPNGMKVFRVRNLRSRILGAGAGEFVTTVDGYVLPIYRFAEKGATIPKVGLAELAAIRVTSVKHGLQALLGKKGFGSEAGYVTMRTLADQMEAVGRAAIGTARGAAAMKAYADAIDRTMVQRLEEVYREAGASRIEEAWRRDPDVYERAYIENTSRLWGRTDNYRVEARLFGDDPGYVSATPRVSETEVRVAARRWADEVRGTALHVREERTTTPRRVGRVVQTPRSLDRGKPQRHRPGVPRPVRKPPYKKKKELEGLTPEQRKGAVAWKQGFIYKLIYPPYGQDDVMYSRRPFKGIRTATGARSAYQSIARMGGEIPKTIERHMGIMAITITTKEGKRPKLEFVRRRKRAAIPRRPRQRASKPAKVVR